MTPKYRAWYKKNTLPMLCVSLISFDQKFIDAYIDKEFKVETEMSFDLDDVILMQSTGLFDKNRVEIFDKDIIKNKDGRLAIVKWHGTYASFVYVWLDELDKNKQDWQPLFLSYMKFEVVGNVYQHPELIEEVGND